MAPRRGLMGCRQGAVAVEFAAFLPLFLILFVPLFEIPRALTQTNALEKGLRSGAVYLARVETRDQLCVPPNCVIEPTIEQNAKNLVLRGSIDGSAPYLAPGWEDSGVSLDDVDIAVSYKLFDDRLVPVIKINANVHFVPIFNLQGVFEFDISRSHEQTWVGK